MSVTPPPVPEPALENDPELHGLTGLSGLQLLHRTRCSGLEVILAAGFYFVLAFAVFGIYLVNGVLMFDDWTLAYDVRRSLENGGVISAIGDLLSNDVLTGNSAGRPAEASYNVLIYGAFGSHAALHLGAAIALRALVAFLFYVVLRWFDLERLHAGVIATLVLLFPASDGTVFWATGAIAQSTIALYLLGLIASIRGLRAEGNARYAFHGLAALLYTASILQYQLAAPLILLSLFAYRFAGATWRRAVQAWLLNVAVAFVTLLYVKANLERREGSLSESYTHARNIAGGARRLLGTLGIQDGAVRIPTAATLLLLLVALVGAVLLRRGDPIRGQLRRWLLVAVVGIGASGAAYAIFIPGDFYYDPMQPGIGNRVNAAAALGYATTLYALAVLTALVIVRLPRLRGLPTTAFALASVAMTVLAGAYIRELNSDRQRYEHAAQVQRGALAFLKTEVPPPAPGTTIYLFGVEGEPSPNIFAFARQNDLTAAVRLLYGDDSLEAVPASTTEPDWSANTEENSGIDCGRDGIQPRGWMYASYPPTQYRRTVFADARSRTSELVASAERCEAALARYGAT